MGPGVNGLGLQRLGPRGFGSGEVALIGCHVGSTSDPTLRWRTRGGHVEGGGQATVARRRRRLGCEPAGERRRSGGCGWYQNVERDSPILMLTLDASGREEFAGGEVNRRRRRFGHGGAAAPVEIRRNGGEHRVRTGVTKWMVASERTRRR